MKEMNTLKIYHMVFIIIVFSVFSLLAEDVGPSKGYLVIVGGSDSFKIHFAPKKLQQMNLRMVTHYVWI